MIGCALLLSSIVAAEPPQRFDRTYAPQGEAHLTISNFNGDIVVTAWNKRIISVRANTAASVSVTDQVNGDHITISVKKSFRFGRADFEVSVPEGTSLALKNLMGKIVVRGVTGYVSVDSFDGAVSLYDIRSRSVDVKVTNGSIYFDGELSEAGTYTLQTIKGDVDVRLPASSAFQLNARAMSENINLGDFLSSLTGTTKGAKGISGTHLRGGPRLSLTTYTGQILLHKK